MSKITTVAELKKWYSDLDIAERSVMGMPVTDENVWLIREQCRMHRFYTPIRITGDNALRFLHVSREDPSKVAYTANDEKGRADIQTRTTLKKYTHKFDLNTDEESRKSGDSLCEANLEAALTDALIIIVGEYPKDDERYVWACKTAKGFNLDVGENG